MGFLKNTMLLWISGDVFVLEMLLPLIQDGVFFNQWLDLWLSKPVKTLQSFSVCLSLIRKKKGCCFVSVKRAYFIGLCYFFFFLQRHKLVSYSQSLTEVWWWTVWAAGDIMWSQPPRSSCCCESCQFERRAHQYSALTWDDRGILLCSVSRNTNRTT